MTLFNKVLIANRGEIARRIIKTCNKLNIKTVAVYSEADAQSPFVNEADEAVCIGKSQAKESYLNIDKILQVASETNADAIHPGYGFLAENANFAAKCKEEGITFIGPTPEVIEFMGSKLESRSKMIEAGIPVVPGSDKSLETVEEAITVANELGYPLMLKASAGGGGMGMKLVHDEDELKSSFQSARQQAISFFGDGSLYLEKLILEPRHIEVQIAGDEFGNIVHLFERECSVQRKHQKIIEESPSPFLNEELREKLYSTAVRGAEHIGYTNVGTMEFIFDNNQNFYFLEMNTRLQVEHPVTEEITALDLVELQIRIAANEKIPFSQNDINRKGHSIECRICAEDPNTHFPSPGTINKLVTPINEARFDFGVIEGSEVTPFYDPMIGKIIVYDEDREKAIQKMKKVIKETSIEGISTNLPLLDRIMKDSNFENGNYTTNLINTLDKITV